MSAQKPRPTKTLTYCGECRRAITQATPTVWQRVPVLGLVHTECAADPDAEPVDVHRADVTKYVD